MWRGLSTKKIHLHLPNVIRNHDTSTLKDGREILVRYIALPAQAQGSSHSKLDNFTKAYLGSRACMPCYNRGHRVYR
jgi:hypothetical protein